MNADLRAPLLVGAVAAGLSMLVGVFSRVSFLPLLLRGLLFGLLFGGLVWGLFQLLHNYLPELFEGSVHRSAEGEDRIDVDDGEGSAVGSAVDIVLDGEEDGPVLGLEAADITAETRTRTEAEPIVEAEPAGDLIDTGAPQTSFAGASAQRQEAGSPSRGAAGMDDLDMLPDLDAFAGSFGGLDMASSGSPEVHSSPSGASSGDSHASISSVAGPGGADPATLAMAVRTLLKRDQKG